MKKINLDFRRFFFLKIFRFFHFFFCSFLKFSVKYTSAIAIWLINSSFWGSDCIKNDLKFWSTVNPGPLPWGTKMLMTRFFKTFWSILPITRDTVKLGKNKFDIHDQHWKLHFSTNFELICWKSRKWRFFDQNFESKLTKNSNFT